MTQPQHLWTRRTPIVSVYCTPGRTPTKTLIDFAGGMSRQPVIPGPLYFCAQRPSQPRRKVTQQQQLQMKLLAQSMELHRTARRSSVWWLMIAVGLFIGVVVLLFIAGRGGG